jgi:hypothetical protein
VEAGAGKDSGRGKIKWLSTVFSTHLFVEAWCKKWRETQTGVEKMHDLMISLKIITCVWFSGDLFCLVLGISDRPGVPEAVRSAAKRAATDGGGGGGGRAEASDDEDEDDEDDDEDDGEEGDDALGDEADAVGEDEDLDFDAADKEDGEEGDGDPRVVDVLMASDGLAADTEASTETVTEVVTEVVEDEEDGAATDGDGSRANGSGDERADVCAGVCA